MRPILPMLLAALAGCAPAAAATRDFPVGPFERISNATPFDVQVRVGGAPAVRAEGTAASLDHLQVAVVDGALTITAKRGNWWEGGHARQRIEVVAPRLTAATVAGPGDMAIDAANAPSFTARLTGPGNLRIGRLAAATVAIGLSGPGDLTIGGLGARVLTAQLGGPGNLTLDGRAEMAALTLRGPGTSAQPG